MSKNIGSEPLGRFYTGKNPKRRRELPKGYIVPDGYNTYTWYKEILRRASSGDQEAINLLKSPVYE